MAKRIRTFTLGSPYPSPAEGFITVQEVPEKGFAIITFHQALGATERCPTALTRMRIEGIKERIKEAISSFRWDPKLKWYVLDISEFPKLLQLLQELGFKEIRCSLSSLFLHGGQPEALDPPS